MEKERIFTQERTSGIWPAPGERYRRFLKKLEERDMPKTLAVLGCADGNYALAAARRGFDVLAIDIDPTALEGGQQLIHGIEREVMGLRKRAITEGLASSITIACTDFISYNAHGQYTGVFTSGSMHYSENSQYSVEEIVEGIKSYVAPGGFLCIEYIVRSGQSRSQSRYFTSGKEIKYFFPENDWVIPSNKIKEYIEGPNPRIDTQHQIAWGRLYAERRKN